MFFVGLFCSIWHYVFLKWIDSFDPMSFQQCTIPKIILLSLTQCVLSTLRSGINMPARLLISRPFSRGHGTFWFWFWFLTEETLLSRRAPNKEALPNPTDQRLPVLILTPQTCQLTHQCMAIIERD